MNRISRPVRFWTFSVIGGAALLVYLFATAPAALDSGAVAKR